MAFISDPQTRQELKELQEELGPDYLLLAVSNLAVIVLALVQGWSIVPLLWVYWWQSVIIGFFNWMRMRKLTNFSTEGFKVDGQSVEATEKTAKQTALFFLLHYGTFHLFYLIGIFIFSKGMESEFLLSATVGIIIFFFNHAFSFRHNLEKDLASRPNIGTMMFFPYARVIPMHLTIFIGLWAGRGSRTELFFFLLLKTAVDLFMHAVEHIDWGKPASLQQIKEKKRVTLKQRIKLWFFLAWLGLLVFVLIVALIVKEING